MEIREHVPLAPYTTLQIGGPARFFGVAESVEDVREGIEFAKRHTLPIFILGGGSNVLIADEGWPGLVLHINVPGVGFNEVPEGTVVHAGAGERWDPLVAQSAARGLWGIENLSGIPGYVGAAPVQNINAYGASVSEVLVSVDAIHLPSGELRSFSRDECQFGYRDSFFKSPEGKEYLIMQVHLALHALPQKKLAYRSASQSMQAYFAEHGVTNPQPQDVRRAVLAIRTRIGMVEGIYRSAGSFFKNTILAPEAFARVEDIVVHRHREKDAAFAPWHWPQEDGREKVSTAFLLECTPYNKTDFAGRLFNDAVGISPVHTLSIINAHSARANDVVEFAKIIIDAVYAEFGILVEPEVEFVGIKK